MSTIVLLVLSGLGVGALYFLLASGLSVIFGLMRILTFAHGAVLSVSAYAAWWLLSRMGAPSTAKFVLAVVVAMALGAVLSAVIEIVILRRLQGKDLEQLLATVGIGLALVALLRGGWGPDPRVVQLPAWAEGTTTIGGAIVPNNRFLLVLVALMALGLMHLFFSRTRQGLIVRAGVENSDMVRALGIKVSRSFTLVFSLGGALAGLAGAMAAVYAGSVSPVMGDNLLVFALIVLVMGGIDSYQGAAVAAVTVGLTQSICNYYLASGAGDVLVIALLALTLVVRPQGFLGSKVGLA